MLTHRNLISNTESILAYLNLDESDSILAVLSFAYSYGNSVLLTHTRVGGMLYIYKAVWISAGRKNRYGHPHDLTLKRLEKSGAKIYSTQDNGAVAVTVRKKTMWIHGGNS